MKTTCLCLLLLLFGSSYAFGQYDSLQPQGIYSSNFIIDEKPRNITYYMPLHYGKLDNYPLLIFLHDDKSNAKTIIKKYGEMLHAKADSADCVIMYPDAFAGYWNSKANGNSKDSINDAGFINIMLDFFVQQYHCNADCIYLAGIGNGGNLCYRINCERSTLIAAIATINTPVDKNNLQNCRKKETIPFLDIKSEANMNIGISKAWNFLFKNRNIQPAGKE